MAQMRCPICAEMFDPERSPAMPFCSERCRGVDRARWLNEEYGLPWEPEEERPEGADGPRDDRPE
jgi:endogenous inhibitor of DNA gyrase (YacG/DUF329 family)